MHKAEFGRAILAEADFTDGQMHAAYLARADLRGAIFSGADISDADFYRADLRGADLSQALQLEQEQLNATCGDETTKLPAGLTPPPEWPCASAEAEEE
jgi:uncharacterized protein YjbI with pentapeptide repeats